MAYALFASATSLLGLSVEAEAACAWLERDALKPDGRVGWGLPFAWDAFADGSVNPASTVYGITTALAVRALLDCRGAGPPASAITALEQYLTSRTVTSDGSFFWYSDRPCDAKCVFNVTSMLAGQYARLGRITGRKDFTDAALDAARYVYEHRKPSEHGEYWEYGKDFARPNDAVHAAYTLIGLRDVQKALDLDIDLGPPSMYIRNFFRDGEAFEFVPHDFLEKNRLMKPARIWGVGALLYAACEMDETDLVGVIEDYLAGRLAGAGDDAVAFRPRNQAHVSWGLARASRL
jgi:hypothetical protein